MDPVTRAERAIHQATAPCLRTCKLENTSKIIALYFYLRTPLKLFKTINECLEALHLYFHESVRIESQTPEFEIFRVFIESAPLPASKMAID